MTRLSEFFEIFDIVVDSSRDQNILCNSVIGAALLDHKSFESDRSDLKTFLKPSYHEGLPYLIGYLDSTVVYIDPNMEYKDLRIFKNRGKKAIRNNSGHIVLTAFGELVYDFNKFKPMDLL